MYTITTYLFWILLFVFVVYSILSSRFGFLKQTEGFSGNKLIDYDAVYTIIDVQRQDDSEKFADVPEKGKMIQFVNENEKGIFVINPITESLFYIHNNHITIKVQSIEENSYPEGSLVANVSAKCKHCQATTDWKLFFTIATN